MVPVVGSRTSSYQKTAEASTCHCAAAPPTISVAALLQVALWCQQHRDTHGGTTPCPAPRNAPFPPAPGTGATADPAAVDATDTPMSASPAPTPQRTPPAPTPDRPRKGGAR